MLAEVAADERVRLRFDGVESLATVWLNGIEVGWFTGSRLPTEFDVTDHLVDGENVLAVRVNQWSAASYVEDQDQWWLPGIFRDVTVLIRPAQGLTDVDVTADYDPVTGVGTLAVVPVGAFPITVTSAELGVSATWENVSGSRPAGGRPGRSLVGRGTAVVRPDRVLARGDGRVAHRVSGGSRSRVTACWPTADH